MIAVVTSTTALNMMLMPRTVMSRVASSSFSPL